MVGEETKGIYYTYYLYVHNKTASLPLQRVEEKISPVMGGKTPPVTPPVKKSPVRVGKVVAEEEVVEQGKVVREETKGIYYTPYLYMRNNLLLPHPCNV